MQHPHRAARRRDPRARPLDLAVIRARARDADRRIGTLVVNPGGPGRARRRLPPQRGVVAARRRCATGSTSWRSIRVGWARANRSSASTASIRVFDQSFEPTTDAAARRVGRRDDDAWRSGARRATATCSRTCRPPTPSTTSSGCAIALGEDRLSFLGYSYGTFLGASYAERVPRPRAGVRARRPVDPSMSARAVTLGSGARLRARARRLPRRLLGPPRLRVPPRWSRGRRPTTRCGRRRRPHRSPPAIADGRTLNQTRFDAAVLQQLYLGRSAWPALADALADAERG